MKNANRRRHEVKRVERYAVNAAGALCSLFAFTLLIVSSGCLERKVELVEKTPSPDREESVVVKVEMQESKIEKNKKEKAEENAAVNAGKPESDVFMDEKKAETQGVLMDEEGMPLDFSFAEISGRSNPFIPPGTAMGVPSISAGTATTSPAYANPSSAVPILAKDPMKGQLMPMAGQTAATAAAVPPIPEWPGESPILSAGPAERLQSLLVISYKGLMSYPNGKRAGIITLQVRDDVKNVINSFRYIVTPGKYVTEYNLKVKEITPKYIVLTRGSQRIELPLLETPRTLPYAVDTPDAGNLLPGQSPYAQKAGSASQWSPSIGGTTGGTQ